MSNVQRFLALQAEVNSQIDAHGSADSETVSALEVLGDSLSPEEVEEVCSKYRDDSPSPSDEDLDEMAERQRAESLYQRGISHY